MVQEKSPASRDREKEPPDEDGPTNVVVREEGEVGVAVPRPDGREPDRVTIPAPVGTLLFLRARVRTGPSPSLTTRVAPALRLTARRGPTLLTPPRVGSRRTELLVGVLARGESVSEPGVSPVLVLPLQTLLPLTRPWSVVPLTPTGEAESSEPGRLPTARRPGRSKCRATDEAVSVSTHDVQSTVVDQT